MEKGANHLFDEWYVTDHDGRLKSCEDRLDDPHPKLSDQTVFGKHSVMQR